MAARAASLVQADFDRAVAALCKHGIKPVIEFDLGRAVVTVRGADNDKSTSADWKAGAVDHV